MSKNTNPKQAPTKPGQGQPSRRNNDSPSETR